MILTVRLAEQEQNRLNVIAKVLKAGNQSEAVRALINEKFEALQTDKTLVERRGGHPQHLLDGAADLSDRPRRKSAIADVISAKPARQAK
jgi:hypothetical protein